MLRSKGFFWLASRPEIVGEWSQAGGACSHEPIGVWWADLDRADWPDDPDTRAEIEKTWDAATGDRRQEIVFIGQRMDRPALSAALDACLLTDAEMALGPTLWIRFPDPLPAWDVVDVETDDARHGPIVVL